MKKRLLGLGVIFLGLGIVSFGLVGANQAVDNKVEVKAADDGNTWGIIGGFSGNSWASDVATSTYDSTTDTHVVSYVIPQWTNFKIRQNRSYTHEINGTVLAAVDSTHLAATDGDNPNAYAKVAGLFTFSIASGVDDPTSSDVTVSYSADVVSHTVTEYAVVGGTKEDTAIGTETCYEAIDFYPSNVLRTGFYTEGWYTDEACTIAYEKEKITADIDLYAKYVVPTDVQYCYFTVDGWSGVKAYSYGGQNQFGYWGYETDLLMTDGAKFNNVGAVYKVTYYTEYGDTHIIFHGTETSGGGDVQTANLSIASGVCYLTSDSENSTGSVDLGTAAALVYDINAARVAVTAADPIVEKSYCGVSASNAASLVGRYDNLGETAKGYVDASTDYTYVYTDTTQSVDVPFTSIIAQLRLNAATANSISNFNSNGNETTLVVGGIAILTTLTFVSYFFFSRKKRLVK